jgi:hypothetical protein
LPLSRFLITFSYSPKIRLLCLPAIFELIEIFPNWQIVLYPWMIFQPCQWRCLAVFNIILIKWFSFFLDLYNINHERIGTTQNLLEWSIDLSFSGLVQSKRPLIDILSFSNYSSSIACIHLLFLSLIERLIIKFWCCSLQFHRLHQQIIV